MKTVWIIANKEFRHLFKSPIAYVVLFLFFLILGLIFYANLVAAVYQNYVPAIQIVIAPMVTLLIFTTPALTMRSISDEYRTGTLELLLTSPIRDSELVLGKWLGTFLFYLCLLALTIIYPIILNQVVDPQIDMGVVISNYIGLLLLCALLSAIGVSISALFKNSTASFFVTLGMIMLLWMLSYPIQATGSNKESIFTFLDLGARFYDNFYNGVINLQDITYFLTMTVMFLFMGTMTLTIRRAR